jgi:Chromo (CHRromatin Organisation MOdifier) domain
LSLSNRDLPLHSQWRTQERKAATSPPLKELCPLAQQRLAEAQARYKSGFDRSVREKNKDIRKEAWVYLRRAVHEPGVNPKLYDQVDGPYQVIDTDGRTFLLQTETDRVRVSSNRLTPAPAKVDKNEVRKISRSPMEEGGWKENQDAKSKADEVEEFVFEKIVGTRHEPDGTLRYRVHWYGYGRGDDTWEPIGHLPLNAVRRYEKRVGLLVPK